MVVSYREHQFTCGWSPKPRWWWNFQFASTHRGFQERIDTKYLISMQTLGLNEVFTNVTSANTWMSYDSGTHMDFLIQGQDGPLPLWQTESDRSSGDFWVCSNRENKILIRSSCHHHMSMNNSAMLSLHDQTTNYPELPSLTQVQTENPLVVLVNHTVLFPMHSKWVLSNLSTYHISGEKLTKLNGDCSA